MARQFWTFNCREQCTQVEPHCSRCGRDGSYVGWSLSVVEMMCDYSRFYRWAPYGDHRKIADQVMDPVTGSCQDCDGNGIQADACDRGFDSCGNCEGTGRIRLCSAEEFERRRQEVIARTGLFKGSSRAVGQGGAA